jgi:heavy metal sensor kinase
VRRLGIRLSIKTTIILLAAINSLIALVLFGSYTYVTVDDTLRSEQDTSISIKASNLGDILDKFKLMKNEKDSLSLDELFDDSSFVLQLINTDDYLLQIADFRNNILWKSEALEKFSLPTCMIDGEIQKSTNGFTNYEYKYKNYRVFKGYSEFFQVSVGIDISKQDLIPSKILNTILISSIFIIAASILLAFFFARSVSAACTNITRRMSSINAKNLSIRIKENNYIPEADQLIKNFNSLMDRVEGYVNQNQKFASDAAHELRTPLTILRGELEIAMHTRKSPEQYEKVVSSALEEVHRLSEIVETLLELSRAEYGKINMNFEQDNISEMILEVVEDGEILAGEKEIIVKSSIQENISLKYDSARIYQVILNLVENAVKYTPRNGKITIILKDDNGHVNILIEDTGIGMNEDELPHIFDRFYRVNSSKINHIKGNGLGLSIVAWIINAHQGTIDVSSNPDKGTRFNIVLPKNIIS